MQARLVAQAGVLAGGGEGPRLDANPGSAELVVVARPEHPGRLRLNTGSVLASHYFLLFLPAK